MGLIADRPSFHELVAGDATLERLADGFWFTEGPVWIPGRGGEPGHLLFNDIPGQVRRRWDVDGRVTDVARPTNNANGMALDHEGRLLICEHASSRVIRLERDGATTVLASRYAGVELNSPNDVVVAADGSVWFTDPRYGRRAVHGIERPVALPFCGVYRIAEPVPGGRLEAVINDLGTPNGLCFSPDGRWLYVNDTEDMKVHRYRVTAQGGVADAEVFFDEGVAFDADMGFPDGMKCDELGNIWVTGPGGIWVVDPTGVRLGVVETPAIVGNFCFGGPDGRWLLVCATDRLLRLRTRVRGAAARATP
jgi:gluconolactonase